MTRKSLALATLALTLAATNAFADAKSKEEKIRTLATLGGMTTRLDEEVAQVLDTGRRAEGQMMAQVNANLDVPPAFRPRFDQVNKKFIDAIQPQWTTFEIIDVFVKAYAPMVSEDDVDKSIAYLTSEAGKRNTAAQAEAASQISALVAARSGNRVPQATQTYVAELRSLIQECNCAKKPAAPAKK